PCARAASGHATAVPPSSDMNARRLMGRPSFRPRAAHYHAVAEERRCASQQKLRADVADGSDSIGVAEATRTFMSPIPLIATQIRGAGAAVGGPYHTALWFEHGVSTAPCKLSTCQPVKVSSLILISCSWRALARLPSDRRKDP